MRVEYSFRVTKLPELAACNLVSPRGFLQVALRNKRWLTRLRGYEVAHETLPTALRCVTTAVRRICGG